MVVKKKNKNPAVFSHEFFIQNHADIMSCVAMLVIIGLMFEATADAAFSFITLQHNVTEGGTEGVTLYQYGRKDLAAVVFYSVIAVVLHAVLQEYGLDKMNRRLHLSKIKHSKFNESGQLGLFYCISFFWGAYLLSLEDYISQPSGLWEGYPHTNMSSHVKFFFICQIAYWVHALPELYFQKIKKEDIPRQLQYITLYLAHITTAYLLNLHRLGLVLMVLHFLVELVFHASRLLYYIREAQQHGSGEWKCQDCRQSHSTVEEKKASEFTRVAGTGVPTWTLLLLLSDWCLLILFYYIFSRDTKGGAYSELQHPFIDLAYSWVETLSSNVTVSSQLF
uniref:TLC domain-containing protein n=1 Tax=Eptatretus burgeri TaxID=7764 RepID=A0A8C4Q1L3_EPTBU